MTLSRLLLTGTLLLAACGAADCADPGRAPAGNHLPRTFDALARASLSAIEGTRTLPGLTAVVEIRRDQWGIPHVYAKNTDDLFFAQGYVVAQDRLWHMEMNRRVSQGRVAEIVGPSGVPHDRLVRLLRFRGPFDEQERTAYHPEARRIFEAYVRGVNAFIAEARDNLPVEFKLTGITAAPWKAEEILVRARVTAAIASARRELRLAQAVAKFGAAEANRRARPDPFAELRVPQGLDVALVTDDVIRGLDGIMREDFPKPALLQEFQSWAGAAVTDREGAPELSPGSNNWAVGANLSATGIPLMVDDPHRSR